MQRPTQGAFDAMRVMMTVDPMLTYRAAAGMLGCSYRTVYRKVPPAEIPERIPNDPNIRRNRELAKEGKKWCSGCLQATPLPWHKGAQSCRDCCTVRARRYYREVVRCDPELYSAVKERNRKYMASTAGQTAMLRGRLKREGYMESAFVEAVDKSVVWDRDEGRCGICGEPADRSEWHLDHIVALSMGGTHEYANVQVAHPFCNISKGGSNRVRENTPVNGLDL